jgi:hypothetical protein
LAFKKTKEMQLPTSPPLIPYLLSKGLNDQAVFHPTKPGVIATRFALLFEKPNDHWKDCRERLDRLLATKGDSTSDAVPEGVQSFNDFLAKMPQWNDKDAFVFHLNFNVPLVQRAQKSGLCYMHAPEVVQHYVVALKDKSLLPSSTTKLIIKLNDLHLYPLQK